MMIDIRRIFKNVLAHASLIASLFIFVITLADAAQPEKLLINSSNTGTLLIVYCVIEISASVLHIGYSFRESSGGLLQTVLPNAVIIMSLLMLTLSITNIFNRSMGFVTSDLSKLLILILSVTGIFMSLGLVDCVYRGEKNR